MGAEKTAAPIAATGTSRSSNIVEAASATSDSQSPVWSSGSGALKEMQLIDLQVKNKSLEKDNARLKEHEEFYIKKAREWKNRALMHERQLKENGLEVPSREKASAKEGKVIKILVKL